MFRRHPIFSTLAAFSLLLCLALSAAWVYSGLHPSDGGSMLRDFEVSVFGGDLRISAPDADVHAHMWSVPSRTDSHDAMGIRFFIWQWSSGTQWWTLSVPMVYLLLLTAVLPVLWLLRRRRWRRTVLDVGTCGTCGYDLRGSGGECPECGAKRKA